VQRIVSMAEQLAPFLGGGAVRSKAAEAASLCKADLVSGVVGEFPELQGIMGGYYAAHEGLDPEVVGAIRDHYRPQGPSDEVPTAPVAATVALADKLDTLVSFFGIGEKPTGSRDPFALRRAALGVIRIVLGTRARLPLKTFVSDELLAFFADRLKVQLREDGQRHDLVDAVFALGDDDLVRIVARVQALAAFLTTEDGANLLAGYKRAVNILKAEEKKGPLPTGAPNPADPEPEERDLIAAVERAETELGAMLARENFAGAMGALAALRAPVDAFFDKVLVNSDVPEQRENRLRLLAKVKDAMGRVADFSQITG
jgi:glycyl-tRNA synthetase beta chain